MSVHSETDGILHVFVGLGIHPFTKLLVLKMLRDYRGSVSTPCLTKGLG